MKNLSCIISLLIFSLFSATTIAQENPKGKYFKITTFQFLSAKQKIEADLPIGIEFWSKPSYGFDVGLEYGRVWGKLGYHFSFNIGVAPYDRKMNLDKDAIAGDWSTSYRTLNYAPKYVNLIVAPKIKIIEKANKLSLYGAIGLSTTYFVEQHPSGEGITFIDDSNNYIKIYDSAAYINEKGQFFFAAALDLSLHYWFSEKFFFSAGLRSNIAFRDFLRGEFTFYTPDGQVEGTFTKRHQHFGLVLGIGKSF